MRQFKFDLDYVREQFPALSKTVNGYPAAFLDGPAGGVVRVGLAPYNTMDEVERTIKTVEDFVAELADR